MLLHPGFHKTGTTTLQHVFRAEAIANPSVAYLGPGMDPACPTARSSRRFADLIRDVRRGRPPSRLARGFARALDDATSGATVTDVIVSEEMLSYSIPEGWAANPLWTNVERLIDAVDAPRSEVTLLLGIRPASEALPSNYAQFRAKYRDRFPSVDDFLRFLLAGGWPGFMERFDIDRLEAGARELGVRCVLLHTTELRDAGWVGEGGLLGGSLRWSTRHPLPRLNARSDGDGSWQADPITLFDRLETVARRFPVGAPPEPVLRTLRAATGKVRLAPATVVRPDAGVLRELDARFPVDRPSR